MSRSPSIALTIVLLALASHVGTAQQPAAAGSPAGCTGALSLAMSTTDRRTDTLYAVAELGYQAPDTARIYAAHLLEEFARRFRLPTPTAFAVWASADTIRQEVAIPVLATEALVVVRPDG